MGLRRASFFRHVWSYPCVHPAYQIKKVFFYTPLFIAGHQTVTRSATTSVSPFETWNNSLLRKLGKKTYLYIQLVLQRCRFVIFNTAGLLIVSRKEKMITGDSNIDVLFPQYLDEVGIL